MANFSSKETEKKIISLFFKEPFHVKALDIDLTLFSVTSHRNIVGLIKKYVQKYKAVPTKETLTDFANSEISDESDLKKIPEAIELLDTLPEVKKEEANYYLEKAQNYKTGRELYDLQNKITNEFEKHEVNFIKLREELFGKLLFMNESKEGIKRGYIYNNAEERWKNYRKMERGVEREVIPYGIKALDNVLGGMRKGFLSLFYGRTGVAKTRLATNILYNNAVLDNNTMYISLEMDYELIASLFDARMSGLDSHKIVFGKLDPTEKKEFAKTLKRQIKEKLNLWISDIPSGATTAKFFEEVEMYRMSEGKLPDLIVIDYANLAEPMIPYSNRSERFDYLFKEFHELMRYYRCSGITMMAESRDASKADLKKESGKGKKDSTDIEGVHNIGASNFAANHCETVVRLKRNEQDELNNRLWAIIDKSRYGVGRSKIPLFAAMDINLIGDRELYAPYKAVVE